jgi:VanZ family protein
MVNVARWIVLVLALAIAAATLCPISFRLMTSTPVDVERVFAFALLGSVIAFACNRRRDLIVSILLAIEFAALLEIGQNFVPSRHGQMHDFLIKALAVIPGAVAVWILRRLHRRPNY